ncbi:MAG TPA: hypothetical protein PKD83_13270 [Ignavibacteria bacterium]|nr:hypothetical protein [Ignavibacteria bacterium]
MENHFKFRKLIILLLFATIAVSFAQKTSFAQFVQKDSGYVNLKEDIENIMKQKLMDSLNLDQASADKFIETYKKSKKDIRILLKEKKELQKSIEQDPGAIDIGTKLNKWMEFDSKIVDSRINYYKELQTFMTSEQIARSIIIRKNMEKGLRKELKKHRKSPKNRKFEKE